jgi:hypothetical protein
MCCRKEGIPASGTSSQNPPVTVVCAPDFSPAKSLQPTEIYEDPLAISLSPPVQAPTKFENVSKSVSLVYSPVPALTDDEVTIKYIGGDPEMSPGETLECTDQHQNGR